MSLRRAVRTAPAPVGDQFCVHVRAEEARTPRDQASSEHAGHPRCTECSAGSRSICGRSRALPGVDCPATARWPVGARGRTARSGLSAPDQRKALTTSLAFAARGRRSGESRSVGVGVGRRRRWAARAGRGWRRSRTGTRAAGRRWPRISWILARLGRGGWCRGRRVVGGVQRDAAIDRCRLGRMHRFIPRDLGAFPLFRVGPPRDTTRFLLSRTVLQFRLALTLGKGCFSVGHRALS